MSRTDRFPSMFETTPRATLMDLLEPTLGRDAAHQVADVLTGEGPGALVPVIGERQDKRDLEALERDLRVALASSEIRCQTLEQEIASEREHWVRGGITRARRALRTRAAPALERLRAEARRARAIPTAMGRPLRSALADLHDGWQLVVQAREELLHARDEIARERAKFESSTREWHAAADALRRQAAARAAGAGEAARKVKS